MKNKNTPPEPVGSALFGATRQAVFRLLYGHPDERFYQRQIVRQLKLGHGTVQRELERLTRSGILLRTAQGQQTYYQANPACPVFEELRSLVQKTFGVTDVLKEALAAIATHIRIAFVFGSVARGAESAESDLDLMLVGDKLSLDQVVPTLGDAQRVLRREVNPSVYHTDEFCRKLEQGHHFLTSVVAGPKAFLIGDDHDLERLAQSRVAHRAQAKSGRNRRTVRRG